MIENYNALWEIKMKTQLILLIILFLYGCHTNGVIKPYSQYLSYKKSINDNSVVQQRHKLFTENFLNAVNIGDNKSLPLLFLAKDIVHEKSYFQKSSKSHACLSINGFEKSGEPTILHIEYKKEGGIWLINYMFVHYIENKKDYITEALCPKEAEAKIFN